LRSAADATWNALATSRTAGGRQLPPIGLVLLAALGAMVLVVVAMNRWAAPQDEHAYWLAGQRILAGEPLYDPAATSVTPYAYWYPPPLAQLVAPITAILPSTAFSWAWTGLLLACLLWLGRRRPLVALALVAFLPVAVELWFRNVHIVLAVIIALGVLRWPWMFAIGAHIKLAPGLGVVYLLVRRQWRDAGLAVGVGTGVLLVSAILGPGLWADFIATIRGRGPADISGVLPIPYAVRAATGLVLTVIAARCPPRWGEPLLVVAIVIASPTLWVDALSMLVALVPVVWLRRSDEAAASRSPAVADQESHGR
jgi:hypothetical protein